MSSIINKVKEVLHGDTHPTNTTHTTGTSGTAEGVHGPHSSRLANAADPRVDSDMDGSQRVGNTTGTHHTTTGTTGLTGGNTHAHGTSGTAEGVHGPHSSRLANAADPRVDSDMDGSQRVGNTTGTHHTTTGATGLTGGNTHAHGTTGSAEGVHGPHSSRLANAADPRVDSDRDGSQRVGGNTTTHHTTAGTTGLTGGNTHAHGTTGTAEGVHGPHSSRLANAADPRVDSDMDGSRRAGTTTGTGYNTSANTTTSGTSSGAGPHSSSLLNKLDSRVDSTTGQVKGTSSTTGTHAHSTTTGNYTGTTGGLSHSTNAGPHDTNAANKLDPRVDSDLDGRGNRHGAGQGVLGASGSHATPGSGTAQNTAGPHNSDMMNKVDPRVDSDMDGSNTMGGNRTHAGGAGYKDPLNAAHVPPSVLREHLGDPQIAHNDPGHNHQGRHGSLTHQETHRGV